MSYGKRHLVLALLAGLVLGLLAARFARVPRPIRDENPAKRLDRIARKLELSADQRLRFEAVFDKNRATMETFRAQTRSEIQAILNERQRAKFDEMTARRDRMRGREDQTR